MQDVTTTNSAIAQIIQQLIKSWADRNKAVTALFNKFEDDVYLKEVAPDRNRAVYLLGHLVAANDSMIPMFGLGERLFPQLEATFLKQPDKAVSHIPSVAELKQYWETLNTTLTAHFEKMRPEEWLERHSLVSEEDFAKDPLRNKLNVLIGRTNHQSYHFGQLAFLSK